MSGKSIFLKWNSLFTLEKEKNTAVLLRGTNCTKYAIGWRYYYLCEQKYDLEILIACNVNKWYIFNNII